MFVQLKIRENILCLESVWTLFVCQRLVKHLSARPHGFISVSYVSYSAITELD